MLTLHWYYMQHTESELLPLLEISLRTDSPEYCKIDLAKRILEHNNVLRKLELLLDLEHRPVPQKECPGDTVLIESE